MGRVRVKSNKLPAVIKKMETETRDAMNTSSRALANDLDAVIWKDTLVLASTIDPDDGGYGGRGGLHATVGVGERGGHGFYVRFLEWGTHNPNALGITFSPDPRVTRTGQAFETEFYAIFREHVIKACRAG